MRTPEVEAAMRNVDMEHYQPGDARKLATEVERLEKENFALQWESAKLKARAETAEARVARMTEMLLAYDAERALYLRRLLWLHDCSTGTTDADGYEWGIYRVKWVNGQAVEVWQTNSDFSDLDAAIERDGYKLPASAKALEARVKELEAQIAEVVGTQRNKDLSLPTWAQVMNRVALLTEQSARLRAALEVELAENQTLKFSTPTGAFVIFATKQKWRLKAALNGEEAST